MDAIFTPIYTPYNDEAEALVNALADKCSISLSGRAGRGYHVILASFLMAVKQSTDQRLVWLTGKGNKYNKAWSFFPEVGETKVRNVRLALEQAGIIRLLTTHEKFGITAELLEASGFDIPVLIKPPSLFEVTLSPTDRSALIGARFIESNRPYLMVSRNEKDDDKRKRKLHREVSPKHTITDTRKKFGLRYSRAVREIEELKRCWSQYPLTMPSRGNLPSELYASATRVFHNSRMENGGRWYGGWTMLSREERASFEIDGEAVIEVDLNASQLTLLSSLTGQPMQCGDTWSDAYQVLVDRLELDEPSDVTRDKVKQLIVELIGTGNPYKSHPADADDSPFDLSDASKRQFRLIRDAALELYPALLKLDKKQMNSAAALQYHEATIITQSMLKLSAVDVPSFSMHDGLIVKHSDYDITVSTLRQVFNDYVIAYQRKHKQQLLNVKVALSVEGINTPKFRLSGCYWT